MEEEPEIPQVENPVIGKIRSRRDLLLALLQDNAWAGENPEDYENGKVAEYTYVSTTLSTEFPEPIQRYLPEFMRILRLVAIPNHIAQLREAGASGDSLIVNFGTYWDAAKNFGFVRITDGEPLSILDYAKVWLFDQAHGPTRIRDRIQEALNSNKPTFEKYKTVKSIFDEEIAPVIAEETTSHIHFTLKDFIDSSLSLNEELRNGLKAQSNTITAFNAAIHAFSNIGQIPAFDWERNSTTYSVPIRYVDEDSPADYIASIEEYIFDNIKVDERLPLVILNMNEKKTRNGITIEPIRRRIKCHARTPEDLLIADKQYKQDATRAVRGQKQKNQKGKKFIDDKDPMTLVMYILAESDEEEVEPDTYIRIMYSFRKGSIGFNRFVFTTNLNNFNLIQENINNHMTKFKLVNVANPDDFLINVRQSFVIGGFQTDNDLLMHLIASNAAISVLLRFSEVDKPWTQKKQLKFQMHMFGQIFIQMSTRTIISSSEIFRMNGLLKAIIRGDKTMTVTVTSQNVEQADIARFVILSLFRRYTDSYEELFNEYAMFNVEREYLPPLLKSQEKTVLFDENATVAKKLSQVNPAIWSKSRYARSITSNRALQVMPITEDQIDMYKAEGRTVFLWPVFIEGIPDEQQAEIQYQYDPETEEEVPIQHFYTTSTIEKPYINFVPNKGPNKHLYPLMPKCQQDPSNVTVNQYDWSISITPRTRPRTTESVNIINKMLRPGQTRNGDTDMADFLGFENVGMLGVEQSTSSLVHCVMHAFDIQTEANNPNSNFVSLAPEDAEAFIQKQRRRPSADEPSIFGSLAHVCKQENPNKTIEEIRADIENTDVMLDPSLHYRLLEEFFQVNIFTFTINNKKKFRVEPPNHMPPYIRMKRDYTQCIIIFKFIDEMEGTAQCELVYGRVANRMGYVFGATVTEKLTRVIANMTQTINIKAMNIMHESVIRAEYAVNASATRLLTFPKIVLQGANSLKPIGQSFDNRGKVRSITFGRGKTRFSVITEPLEPLNLQLVEPSASINIADFTLLSNITTSNGETMTHIMYTPENDKLAGIWFRINDIEMYMPIQGIAWNVERHKPVKFDIAFHVNGPESETEKLTRLQKVSMMYIQIIKRLYVKARTQMGRMSVQITPEDFVTNYMIVNPNQRMDVSGCDGFVPNLEFDDLYEYFQGVFPKLFYNGKIVADSERTRLNILRRLIRFQEIRSEQTELTSIRGNEGSSIRVDQFPPFLSTVFSCPEDYVRHTPYQMVFMSYERFELEKTMALENNPLLVETLAMKYSLMHSPYFYLHNRRRLYIIQNVDKGNMLSAVTLAKFWRATRINGGYFTPPNADLEGVHQVELSTRQFNDEMIMVLHYDEARFAAILPFN